MSEQENLKAVQAMYQALNTRDWSVLDPYYPADCVVESSDEPHPITGAQRKARQEGLWKAFPDYHIEAVLTITQGEYVVTHWKITGTHTGPLDMPSGASIPPTGKKIVMLGSSTDQVRNGKFVHTWNFYDMASTMRQLGLLPPM
jgi:predicted ester cyclase